MPPLSVWRKSSEQRITDFITAQVDDSAIWCELKYQQGERMTVKQLESSRKTLKKIETSDAVKDKDDVITF